MILNSANIIDNDRNKSYIDLRYFIPDTPEVYIIIISRSLIAKEIITLEAVKVAEIKLLEARELF